MKIHTKCNNLSQINPVNTTPSYLSTIHFNNIHHLFLGLLSGIFLSRFPPISYMHSFLFHLSYMPSPPNPPWLDHSKYTSTWQIVQIMKLLIMQLSPASCPFILLRFKYPPQHLVPKHPQSMFHSQCQRSSFTPILYHRQNQSCIFYVLCF
jgi:hypothetical protein